MRRGVIATLIAIAGTAEATPYETFVDITDQADLEDLFAAGDITQDTFEELLLLLNAGIDLNLADRATLYQLPNLTYDDVDAIIRFREKERIRDPIQLVKAGALSEDKLFAIASFIEVAEGQDRYNVKGFARLQTRMTPYDNVLPPWMFRARFTALKHWQFGVASTFTRLDIGQPLYDPNRDALIADPAGYRFALPKAFVKYETDEGTLIAGSFKAGFGQRLVFDRSGRYTPNGLYFDDDMFFATDLVRSCRQSAGELATSPCDPDTNDDALLYVTPDYTWRDGLFGVGAGFKNANLGGTGWLQGYVWASASNRYVYQYELANRSQCVDPSDDTDPTCSAPTVFVRPKGNLLQETSRFSFVTLPDVFQERVAGVNVAYFADRRNSIGLTAYGATETNLVKGIELDTQEWSRIPTGRRFGAAGANMSFGRDWLDVFAEAAFSYRGDALADPNDPDGSPLSGGGPAGIVRMTATRKKEELEAVFRYYSKDFINPFARPIAQPDELDGQRARDELGVRLRYYKTDKLFTFRALLDLWENPSERADDQLGRQLPKLDAYVRGDVRTTEEIRLGLWLRYQDKDLRAGGNGQCFEVSTEEDENGEPIPCGGRQLTTVGRVSYRPNRQFQYTLMLQHQLLDDPTIDDQAFRQDLSGWLVVLFNPTNRIRVRARARYLDEAFGDDLKLETSLSTILDAAFKVRKKDTFRVRFDTRFLLDDRASTLERTPNPELQFWLTYEVRL
jgi:hypothetical protein